MLNLGSADDGTPAGLGALTVVQRRLVAGSAFLRQRGFLDLTPFLDSWGMEYSTVSSLADWVGKQPTQPGRAEVRRLIEDLQGAPVFNEESRPTVIQEFQLGAIEILLALAELWCSDSVELAGRVMAMSFTHAYFVDQNADWAPRYPEDIHSDLRALQMGYFCKREITEREHSLRVARDEIREDISDQLAIAANRFTQEICDAVRSYA